MRLSSTLLSLSLLSFLQPSPISAQAASDAQPQSASGDEILKRNAIIEERLAQQQVAGVRKMSDDEGEKFFLHYWYFDDETGEYELGNVTNQKRDSDVIEQNTRWRDVEEETSETWANGSALLPFRPSFPLHADYEQTAPFRLLGRYLGAPGGGGFSPLIKRAFQCPAGTYGCDSIGRPSSCCGAGETCQLIEDTGLGDVGCCPHGRYCSGGITSCKDGYSSCPNSPGGGCCIPGYKCVDSGCEFVSTLTVTVHPTATLSSSILPSPTSTPGPTSATPTTTAAGTTETLAPPARPTSLSTVTTEEPTGSVPVCPTGFYACSAVYQGGCCRTGRNCDTTSCPAVSSTTIISEGRTIAIPVPTDVGNVAPMGRCASGWFSCADTVGGGCCPKGFACGTSCTATAAPTATVEKSQPVSGGGRQQGIDSTLMRIYVLGALSRLLWIV